MRGQLCLVFDLFYARVILARFFALTLSPSIANLLLGWFARFTLSTARPPPSTRLLSQNTHLQINCQ